MRLAGARERDVLATSGRERSDDVARVTRGDPLGGIGMLGIRKAQVGAADAPCIQMSAPLLAAAEVD
jgi:hypothetical protein